MTIQNEEHTKTIRKKVTTTFIKDLSNINVKQMKSLALRKINLYHVDLPYLPRSGSRSK